MNTNQKSKWWVDAALFAVFIATFFLNITGLDLHQWIGVAAGTIAGYHLITHWKWVSAVTGLVISTWLNLPLDNYDTWRVVHIAASIFTLVATVAKIGLHWRWIVTVAKSLFAHPSITQRHLASSNGARRLRRREFLGMMGGVSLVSVFALNACAQALQLSPVQENSLDSTTDSSLPAASSGANSASAVATGQPVQPSPTATIRSTITPTLTAKPATTATVTVAPTTATVTTVPTQSPVASSCVVRCSNGCSYPGRCRRYVDANGNDRCDLGECL